MDFSLILDLRLNDLVKMPIFMALYKQKDISTLLLDTNI